MTPSKFTLWSYGRGTLSVVAICVDNGTSRILHDNRALSFRQNTLVRSRMASYAYDKLAVKIVWENV